MYYLHFYVATFSSQEIKIKSWFSQRQIISNLNRKDFSQLSKFSPLCNLQIWEYNQVWKAFYQFKYFYSVSKLMIFQGTYKNYECGIEVSNADAEDDGEWTCEIESWVKRGKRGDGDVARVS